MSVYFVTGKLGSGKTLITIGRIRDYLLRGRPVATNLDINLEHLLPHGNTTAELIRLPDKPTIHDLEALGSASHSKRESDNGLIVLDELGTWLNTRGFQDKSRQPVIDWFLHSRKLQWDLYLIIQDLEMVDKQARIALAEHVVFCKRTDRLSIPFISSLIKIVLGGKKLKLPQVHTAFVYYGCGLGAVRTDTWIYRGRDLYNAYDTNQIFSNSYKNGLYKFLPPGRAPWLLRRRCRRDWGFYMRVSRIYWKRFSRPILAGCAFSVGVIVAALLAVYLTPGQTDATITAYVQGDQGEQIAQGDQDGQIAQGDQVEQIAQGDPGDDVIDIETEDYRPLQRLNYISNGKWIRIYYEGEEFSLEDFPYDVVIKHGEPYARVPVESARNVVRQNGANRFYQ